MALTATEQDELQRTGTLGNVQPTYGYYRQPNGWIKPAVVTELEELKYRREGWVPLPQYGRFDMSTGYAADHPLELLLMNGGARELCEDQIRQQGFYFNPPVLPTCRQALTQNHRKHGPRCWVGAKPAEFPQVAAMKDLGPFQCRFCDRQNATLQGRDQHERVMHKDDLSAVRTGEGMARALGNGGSKEPTVADTPGRKPRSEAQRAATARWQAAAMAKRAAKQTEPPASV